MQKDIISENQGELNKWSKSEMETLNRLKKQKKKMQFKQS